MLTARMARVTPDEQPPQVMPETEKMLVGALHMPHAEKRGVCMEGGGGGREPGVRTPPQQTTTALMVVEI